MYSTLVLWQLPVALHIVRWVLLTVVQLPCSNVLQFVLMPTLSLGMVLLNPYNSSPSDCIIGAICNKNKHKNALLVNKTILPCFLGCRNCLGRCTSAYSVKRSARWVAATPIFTDRTGTQPLQHHNHSLQAEHKSKTSQTSRQKLHNKK